MIQPIHNRLQTPRDERTKMELNKAALASQRRGSPAVSGTCCHPDLVQVGNFMPPDLKGKAMKFDEVCPCLSVMVLTVFSGLPLFEIGNVPEKLAVYAYIFSQESNP